MNRVKIISEYIGADGIPMIIIELEDISHILRYSVSLYHCKRDSFIRKLDSTTTKPLTWYSSTPSNLGLFHRIDGPAIISFSREERSRREEWLFHGKRHCDTGPSVIWSEPSRNHIQALWYIKGNDYSDAINEWLKKCEIISSRWWEWGNDEKIIFKMMWSGL